MWESSDWLVEPISTRVLSGLNFKIILGLTIFNAVLWFVSTVLQFVLVGKLSDNFPYAAPLTLLGISAGWSLLIFLVTAGSIYGVLRNNLKNLQAYIVLTAITGGSSLLIFIFHTVTLSLHVADEKWFGPGGFTIFTGLYVLGESCIIVPYVYYLTKEFKKEIEEAKMDKMRRMIREQQQQQINSLIESAESFAQHSPVVEVLGHNVEDQPPIHYSDGSSSESDQSSNEDIEYHVTYYPPVFV